MYTLFIRYRIRRRLLRELRELGKVVRNPPKRTPLFVDEDQPAA